ncbi:hypothetical protein SpCBS45565_g05962 [Spizellomyces sp. 'palustris']|nr:hypothetical protein SpCBS45565_g05962 [Spizellomyces sp. 'palustris']
MGNSASNTTSEPNTLCQNSPLPPVPIQAEIPMLICLALPALCSCIAFGYAVYRYRLRRTRFNLAVVVSWLFILGTDVAGIGYVIDFFHRGACFIVDPGWSVVFVAFPIGAACSHALLNLSRIPIFRPAIVFPERLRLFLYPTTILICLASFGVSAWAYISSNGYITSLLTKIVNGMFSLPAAWCLLVDWCVAVSSIIAVVRVRRNLAAEVSSLRLPDHKKSDTQLCGSPITPTTAKSDGTEEILNCYFFPGSDETAMNNQVEKTSTSTPPTHQNHNAPTFLYIMVLLGGMIAFAMITAIVLVAIPQPSYALVAAQVCVHVYYCLALCYMYAVPQYLASSTKFNILEVSSQ